MTTENKNLIEVRHLKKYFPIKGGVFKSKIGDVKAVDDDPASIGPDLAGDQLHQTCLA